MSDLEYLKKYVPSEKLEKAIEKLERGIPVQYIVGTMDFYGYEFKVNEHVLIPRFETEELVARTIKYIQKYQFENPNLVDIGTGSGCIAITLSKELNLPIDAIDISMEALQVARENNDSLKANVHFYHNDLLENMSTKYDVIISNPPYISYDEEIEDIVRNNEPSIALFASDNGLYFYKEILKNIRKNLKAKSLIAFEIGASQAEEIILYTKKIFQNATVWKEQDLAGFDRYIFIYIEG